MTAFFALGAIGLIGMAYKSVFVLAAGSRAFPPRLDRALRFASPAMLAAMIGSMLSPLGRGGAQITPAMLLALLAGGLVAHRKRSIGWTLSSGLTVFWLVSMLGFG